MEAEESVSAFAAYGIETTPKAAKKSKSKATETAKTKKSAKNVLLSNENLSQLSRSQIIATLLDNKKQDLKQKTSDNLKQKVKNAKKTRKFINNKSSSNIVTDQTEAVAGPSEVVLNGTINASETGSKEAKRSRNVTKKKTDESNNKSTTTDFENNVPQSTPKPQNVNPKKVTQKNKPKVRTSPKTETNSLNGTTDGVFSKLISKLTGNSIEDGQNMFAWIINPIPLNTFMNNVWEKSPILVDRKCSNYYKQLLSTSDIDKMLREHRVEYTKNIDVTSYRDGIRETHNLEGRAMPPAVWDQYSEGCSIRILNPQTFIPRVHSLIATLQEYVQCMTGANVYLTPANSQGFAPHYDDIEAFVLQIEGKKHWKVYKPRTVAEELPRESSTNFAQSEIGEPVLDITVEAGDLLYFPRGYIHQATTVPGHHSLHITLSVYQKHTYGDLLEILLPMALREAIAENVSLRQGLPLNIWQCMGLVNSDVDSPERTVLLNKLKGCFNLVLEGAPFDDAVDQMALRYQHDAMPPFLSPDEDKCTVYQTAAHVTNDGTIDHPIIEIDTEIRLVRANVLRLIRGKDGEFLIYYNSENSKEYHEYEPNFLGIGAEDAPGIELLVKAYPVFVTPKQLELSDDVRCLAVAQDLWERGILMTREQLQ